MRTILGLAIAIAFSGHLFASPSSEQALNAYFLQEKIGFNLHGKAESAHLFLPLRGFLKSIPMGFSICSESFENGAIAKVSLNPKPQGFLTSELKIQEQCISIANPVFVQDTLLEVEIAQEDTTAKLSYQIQPKTGLVYKDRVFRMLQASRNLVATIFYPSLSPASSEYSIVCTHKPSRLLGVHSKPFGSEEDFTTINDITVLDEFCSEVKQDLWTEGFWENFYEFSTEPEKVKLIEHVEK